MAEVTGMTRLERALAAAQKAAAAATSMGIAGPARISLWLKIPNVASCDALFDINDVTQDDLDRLKLSLSETRAKAAAEKLA